MITDPYQVLGVSRRASEDEIKRAYRELSRKYHPDTNANNPLADLAEEKFKEVQQAYEQIMNERERGGQSSYGSSYSSQNSSYSYSDESSWQNNLQMVAAANYINNRHYREALNVLSGINDRSGYWYHFNALAHAGMGNNMEALNFARQAVNIDPGNREFNDLLGRLQWSGQRYQNNGNGYGYGGYNGSSCGTGNLCCDLWCADSLCECMGGDICSCM